MGDTISKQAFVLYGIGQSYIDQCILLSKYLIKYTSCDVLIYYSQGKISTYLGPRAKTINLKDNLLKFKKDPIHQIQLFQSIKPYILKDSLNYYDELVYLDSDIQVTPNINKLFTYHKNISNYPLVNRYQWEFMLYNNQPWVSEYILNHLKNPKQCLPTLCSCLMVFNKECKEFLVEWFNLTQELLEEYISNPKWKNKGHDEGTLNGLFWKNKYTQYLPSNLAWVKNENGALETFNLLNSPNQQKQHPGDPSHILLETSWGGGMGNSPNKIENLYGFHTIKDINDAQMVYYITEKNFNI